MILEPPYEEFEPEDYDETGRANERDAPETEGEDYETNWLGKAAEHEDASRTSYRFRREMISRQIGDMMRDAEEEGDVDPSFGWDANAGIAKDFVGGD